MRILLLVPFLGIGCAVDDVSTDSLASNAAPPPRLIAPLSTTHATTKLPTFTWEMPQHGGFHARVQICADRACSVVVDGADVDGTSWQPTTQLADGATFWNVSTVDNDGIVRGTSATWELWPSGMFYPQPGLAGPPADTTFGSVLDVNGDGYADLAVGSPDTPGGTVSIFFGGPNGPSETPDVVLEGAGTNGVGGYGATVASAGDVDGDGFGDLAVAGDSGAHVVYGGASGIGSRSTDLLFGPVTTERGATMATAMDVDGDGYADLLVGGREVAQVYRGGAGGIATTASWALDGLGDSSRVDGGADVNGDRHPDVMVNGWSYLGTGAGFVRETAMQYRDGRYAGDVNGDGLTDYAGSAVYAGTPSGLSTQPWMASAGVYFFGSAGDSNGDGFFETMALESSLTGLPPWRVYYGWPFGNGGPSNEVDLPGGRPIMRQWAAAGDVDGDTYEDVAVGVLADHAVYLFQGPGVPTTPTRTITGPGSQFGYSVQ